ncbi:MAG: beta strand repeat-containing protein, partial [Roseimicrobium sp.]
GVSTAANTLTLTGAVNGSGRLTKSGDGGLTLSGANTFTNGASILGGTLTLDYTTANNSKLDANSALTLGGGALAFTPNASADSSQTVLSTTFSSGANTVTVTKNAATHNATLNLNALTRSGGATVNFAYAGTGSGIASTTTDTTNTNSILGGWATFGGTDWAVNSTNAADGRVDALAGASYYTTTTGGNTAANYASKHLDVTSSPTLSGAITPYTLRFNQAAANTVTLTGTNTISSSGILVTANVGNNLFTITSGTIRGPANGDLIIHQYNTANALTIASVIGNNASTRLVKTGPGTVNLTTTTNSTFTGGVVVNQGILNRNTVNAITNNAANVITIRNGGTFVQNYDSGNAVVPTNPIFIEAGGTLTNGGSFYTTLADVTLSGGTITAVGGRNGSYQAWGLRGTVTVNGDVTSTINAPNAAGSGVQLGHREVDTVTFDVADGAAQTDLAVSASLRDSRTTANDAFQPSSLVKNGAGTLVASAANTFTGTVTVNSGTLRFTGANTFAGAMVNGGVLQSNSTFSNSASNTITVNNGGTLLFGASNVYGAFSATPVAPIVINAGGTVTNNGAFYSALGPVTLYGGTLTSVGGFSATYLSWALKDTLTVNGATTSTISATGTNAGIGLGAAAVTEATINVADGAAATDLLISAVLGDGINVANTGTQPSSLTKTGAGLVQLTAANTYSGTTNIDAGTFALSATGTIANSTAINLASGAILDVTAKSSGLTIGATQTLTGGRTSGFANDVLGSLVNAGTLNPGGDGTAATLTLSSDLTLNGGSNIRFDFGADGTLGGGVNDLLSVAGALNASGVTTIVAPSSVPVSGVTYTLISAGSLGSGTAANFAFGSSGTRQTYTFDTTTTPGSVLLTAAGSAANLVWTGAIDGNWDVNTTTNWSGAPDQKFFNLDNVTFNDTSSIGAVTIGGNVQPLSVTVNNSSGGTAYSFSGAGAITGTTGIVKTGTGSLTLSTQNTFAGAVEIQQGSVSVASISNTGSASALGAGSSLILGTATTKGTLSFSPASSGSTNKSVTVQAGGGDLDVSDSGGSLTLSGAVTGSGAFTKTGPGVLVLSGLNTHTGTTTISSGTLRAGSANALGSITGGTVIQSGATLDVGGFNLGAEPVSVSGTGVGGNGAILNSGAQQTNALRFVTLTGDTTFATGTSRWDIRGTGVASTATLDLAGFKLTKTGTGSIALVSTVIGNGDIDVNGGRLS